MANKQPPTPVPVPVPVPSPPTDWSWSDRVGFFLGGHPPPPPPLLRLAHPLVPLPCSSPLRHPAVSSPLSRRPGPGRSVGSGPLAPGPLFRPEELSLSV